MFGLRTRTWVIGGVIAALIGTGAIASRYQNHSYEDRADFATYMITKKLKLNDTQEAALDALAADWVGAAGTMKSFRKSMLDEVKTLAAGENMTVEQVYALRDKFKAEIDRKTTELAPKFVAFYNGLDADQKGKIIARLDGVSEHMGKRGSRHHKNHEGGHKHRFWHDSQ